MNFSKILQIARWEFLEKVRTKAFLISLILTPLIMVGFSVVPTLLMMREDEESKMFLVYDETNSFLNDFQNTLNEKYKLANGKPNFILVPVSSEQKSIESLIHEYSPRILNDEFTGLFIIPKNVEQTRKAEYRSGNLGNIKDLERLSNTLEQIMTERLALKNGINMEVYKNITKSLDVKTIKIDKNGKEKESGFMEAFGAAYGSAMIMMFLVLTTGQLLVRSLLEEKSNRIIEILLSSCSAQDLMAGKLLGLSGLGIFQTTLWGGIGIGASMYFGKQIAVLAHLPLLLIFMLLGYVLFASLFLGLGSLASTEQEAQQITSYITLLSVAPMMMISVLLQNPTGSMVKIMSYIPFLAPTVMAMRIAIAMPQWWELLLSIGILLLSVILVVWVCSKIFRVAILSYGKRPSMKEILGFLRE